MMTATAALDATASPAVTAGLRIAQPRQRQLPESGWFFIGHNVVKALERLPRKQQATARSVLMAYCQLSSRNSNAATFSAAVRLVADMAGVSEASVKRLDYFFKVAGIMDIALVKDERGLDAPRRITLHEEPKAVAETYEELTADEIRLALPARRERPVAQHVVSVVSDTKERIKETSKETISLFDATVHHDPHVQKRERGSWELAEERLAKEYGMTLSEVQAHRRKHEAAMAAGRAAGRVKGFVTEASLGRYLSALPPQSKAAPNTDRVADAIRRAEAARSQRWQQFAATKTNVPTTWHEADDDTRFDFAASNEGAGFRNLAIGWSNAGRYFTLNEDTCEITATPSVTSTRNGFSPLLSAGNKWKL